MRRWLFVLTALAVVASIPAGAAAQEQAAQSGEVVYAPTDRPVDQPTDRPSDRTTDRRFHRITDRWCHAQDPPIECALPWHRLCPDDLSPYECRRWLRSLEEHCPDDLTLLQCWKWWKRFRRFCPDDLTSSGCWQWLRELWAKCPDDWSFTKFWRWLHACRSDHPPIRCRDHGPAIVVEPIAVGPA